MQELQPRTKIESPKMLAVTIPESPCHVDARPSAGGNCYVFKQQIFVFSDILLGVSVVDSKSIKLSVEGLIYLIRGERIILDQDLAPLYGVETKVLVQAVKRNSERFPKDFMFQLSDQEFTALRSQIVTSKGRGGRRLAPYAFTEQGVAMLSSVLRSKQAVRVNIEIMRAFVRLRRIIESHAELADRLLDLEQRHEQKFQLVFDAIKELTTEKTVPRKRQIGFGGKEET